MPVVAGSCFGNQVSLVELIMVYLITPVQILISMAILNVPFQICSGITCLLEEELKVPDSKIIFLILFKSLAST